MAILLIRHGETAWNAARILQRPETPLSDRGRAQAERLAGRLAGAGVTRILASDLARAAMTAEPIGRATGAPIERDPVLRERDFGDLRGTPYAELSTDIFAPDYVPPGGESWPRFHARVARAWQRIVEAAAAGDGSLAVVTHGLVCRALVDRHLRAPAHAAPERWANASLTVIEPTPPWTVRLLNCTAHLEGLDAGGDPGAA
jgi:probable phosphoglycerate mutase